MVNYRKAASGLAVFHMRGDAGRGTCYLVAEEQLAFIRRCRSVNSKQGSAEHEKTSLGCCASRVC
jgi:hypothetical protein